VLVEPLAVPDSFVLTPRQFGDERGTFLEWFTAPSLREATGREFTLAQANCSVSARGVLRGVHFADVPPGQAKYVTCVSGAVLDVIVDLRVGSPTFGASDAVLLDTRDRRAVFLAEGLGHAFLSLEEQSTVVYLCSTGYNPAVEREVHPLDPALELPWPSEYTAILSAKDAAAPTLAEAAERGILPSYEQCVTRYSEIS
jgi:dTDP-4-dehydrorhamnose 3,5-epimerase